MAFIGTPLDTRNTFQSLQGKRFNGDGSTTDFTLDVAPGSTLDIEVFVGNVRQDPNSAYTLSGTTLSFTGAPPSGTNNIYVVHQAKSVGTITPGANSVGVTELNLSDGSSGQFIKTDGSGTLSFASVASLAGIDDQSSSNDDQLTITDTAVVINEDSDDVDFRVESNGNANMLTVNGGSDLVGIASDPDLGSGLHIKISDTGASASSSHDQLVIEKNGDMGMTLLGSNSAGCFIAFGDDGDNDRARIGYDHNADRMTIKTGGTDHIRINSSGDVGIGIVDPSRKFHINTTSVTARFQREQGDNNQRTHLEFVREGNTAGEILCTNSATSYATSSDYRLKENVNYTWDATTRLKQLKPARFNWIADDTNTLLDGFLAHEVSSIVPEAINGDKDATETKTKVVLNSTGGILAEGVEQSDWTQGKTDGSYPSNSTWEASKTVGVYQGIDQAKLVPLLVKTVQELEARIKTQEEA